MKHEGIAFPQGASWHRDLLNIAENNKMISPQLVILLGEYLAFRHFFTHAYALELYPEKMESLVEKCENVYLQFKDEIYKKLKNIKKKNNGL